MSNVASLRPYLNTHNRPVNNAKTAARDQLTTAPYHRPRKHFLKIFKNLLKNDFRKLVRKIVPKGISLKQV